ncbi:MAG: rRNA maturation RNAse YbeY [Candidatus Fermentibacteria bacterium]|nr:rRNA maturation RNAse YbeY [Candidatus Fermentibacteria bacterium]
MGSNQDTSARWIVDDSDSDASTAYQTTPSVSIILDNPQQELFLLNSIVQKTIKGPVEFVICDPGVMRFLNYSWRKINKPTDVLTFDLSSPEGDFPEGVVYIDGRMAPPLEEVLERLYHGWLHLKGFTHDTEEDTREMNRLTVALVKEGMKAVKGI